MTFYVAGAEITAMIPVSVLAPTQGLNITAISYCDEIYFGITADPQRLAEPWQVAEGVTKALVDLKQAADSYENDSICGCHAIGLHAEVKSLRVSYADAAVWLHGGHPDELPCSRRTKIQSSQ